MTLFAKTVAERTRPGQRQDVEEQGKYSSPPSAGEYPFFAVKEPNRN